MTIFIILKKGLIFVILQIEKMINKDKLNFKLYETDS